MGRGGIKVYRWKLLGGLFLVLGGAFVGWIGFRAWAIVSEQNSLWERAERELLAKGESLDEAAFIPPPIPASRNFFSDSLWSDLSDRVPVEWAGTVVKKNRIPAKERRTYDLGRPFRVEERRNLEAAFPEFAPLADADSRRAVAVARELWDREKNANAERRRRAAEFLLAASAPVEPILSRIDGLLERPEAGFAISYRDGFAMGLEHLVPLVNVGGWWQLRGLAALELQDLGKASRNVLRIFRLGETLRNEPLLLSVLARAQIYRQGLELINTGIVRHSWREEDLREMENALGGIDLIPALARALRFERAVANRQIEELLRNASSRELLEALGFSEETAKSEAPSAVWQMVYLHFRLPGDKADFNRRIQSWVEALDAAEEQGLQARSFPDFASAAHETTLAGKKRFFSSFLLRPLASALSRVAWIQNQIFLTRIACALETYWLKRGEYPQSLQDAVPGVLEVPLLDPVTLRVPRYERTGVDRFRLWSPGWDGVDEGGVSADDHKNGDWVWGL